jgi:hypothetical protein
MSEKHPGRWPYYSVNLALWPGEFCQIGDVVDDFQTAHHMAAAAIQVHGIWTEESDVEHFAEIYGESRTFDGFSDDPASEEEDFDWYMEGESCDPPTRQLLAYVAGDGLHLGNSERAIELHAAMQDAFEAEIVAGRSAIDDPDSELALEHGAAFKGGVVTFPSLDAANRFGEARANRSMQTWIDGMRGYTDDQAERADALFARWKETSAVSRQKNAQALAVYLFDIQVLGKNRLGHTAGAGSSIADSTRKIVEAEVAEVLRRYGGRPDV